MQNTYSVYAVTSFQRSLCEPMVEYVDLWNGYHSTPQQAPDRADWRKQPYYARYTKWCEDQGEEIGLEPPELSRSRRIGIGLACMALQPLKHLAACVESIVRVPLCLLAGLATLIAPDLHGRLQGLGGVTSNARQAVCELLLSAVYTAAVIGNAGFFFPRNVQELSNLPRQFDNELKTLNGDQMWQIMAEARQP